MADIKIEDLELPSAVVEDVPTGSVAEGMGLKSGDEIIAINGQEVTGDQIPEAIWDSRGALTLTVKRGANSVDLGPVEPTEEDGIHKLGFALASAGRLSDMDMEQVTGGVMSMNRLATPVLRPGGSLASRLRSGLINPIAGVRA